MIFTKEIVFDDNQKFLNQRNNEARIEKINNCFKNIEENYNKNGLIFILGKAGASAMIEEFDWYEFDIKGERVENFNADGKYTSSFFIDYQHNEQTNTISMVAKEIFTSY